MQTQVVTPLPATAADEPWWLTRNALLTWWLLGGIALGFAIGSPPVQRTQEARVLETAREMMGKDSRGYLVPVLNGRLRVRKPPLTYWMAVGAFKVGGVSEGVGRVPTVVLGWLTLAVTFLAGQWLFGRRAGFFAAACLLTSYLFFKHSRLAETDAPAMFFVTLAVYAFWRGAGEGEDAGTRARGDGRREAGGMGRDSTFAWYHLGAAATALAIMSKGPPGFYPPVFLLALCAVRRRWQPLVKFFTSGAPLTLLILAAPWFVYVLRAVGIEQWKHESDELLGGEGHGGPFYQYFVEILKATAPWCLLVPGSLVAAVQRRRDPRVVGVLLWAGVVFVPLCFLGNKQFHYLMSLMPPLMIGVGWWLDSVLGSRESAQISGHRIPLIDATMLIALLGVPGILYAARRVGGDVGAFEVAMAVGLAVALVAVGWLYVKRGYVAAVLGYVVAAAILFVPAVGVWLPRLEQGNSRLVAAQIRARDLDGPYCFYGPAFSLPLCFNLRTEIPQARTGAELLKLAAAQPDIVAIAQAKSKYAPPPPPPGFEQQGPEIEVPGQSFKVYRYRLAGH